MLRALSGARLAGALAICCLAFTFSTAHSALAAEADPALLAGLRARSIGPAGMSGRVADIVAVERQPEIVYVGAATGGLWKSVNAGLSWQPLFDDQPVAAIGAVAVFQANPDIVWVGTGEGNPRNSISVGNGIYKSLDAGRSWTHLGLENTERIHRIVLHPSDPAVAWVAALGRTWGENEERGVFKTVDGGTTWTRVLYVDERTGAADLVIDPSNPQKLFATMWEHRRWPWFFRSGGPGSGLYVTHDGGATWKRFTEDDGLPAGELGRIGVAVCRSEPQVVYALVEAESSALVRSDDGGHRWRIVNRENDVANRPFYYADLRCDPQSPHRVYNLASRVTVSDDGGRTFERLPGSRQVHGDYQALWIDPADADHLVIGNDGGVAISHDRGETFRFVENLPLAQYYHVAVDLETPYNVYGGMQDNGSWRGPSSVRGGRGIPSHRWVRVGFGDGFDTRPDPEDPSQGYAMWQGGNLLHWDLASGASKPIKPPQPGDEELRFNWNAALAIDPFAPQTIYYGSQFVHKSTDRGRTWTVISPDLTTDNPEWQKQAESGGLTPDVTGAENFTTIIALAPSPVAPGVLWAGTDDGRLHVTRDGGATWTSVEDNLPGAPANTWIPHVEPSSFDAAEAFVVLDDHRRSNWTPYVFVTRDFGATWKSLATDELSGYALSIVQDPVERDLLFLGTEFGLWWSTDGGVRWHPWRHGVPTAGVRDLVIHPREHDLVIGTHGRAAFVLDDISPLRHLDEIGDRTLHLFALRPARQGLSEPQTTGNSPGAGEFEGENRPYGALIHFWLEGDDLPHPDEEIERGRKEERRRKAKAAEGAKGAAGEKATAEAEPTGAGRRRGGRGARGGGRPGGPGGPDADGPQVEITVTDVDGTVVRTFEAPARLGLNRAVWDLGRDPFERPRGDRGGFRGGGSGPQVRPGTYRVAVAYGDQRAEGTIEVLADPSSELDEAGWRAREEVIGRIADLTDALAAAVDRISETRGDVGTLLARARSMAQDGEDDGRSGSDVEESGGEDPAEEGEDDPPADEPAGAADKAPDETTGGGNSPLEAVQQAGRELQKALDDLEARFRVPPDSKGIVRRQQVDWAVRYATWSSTAGWEAPSATDLAYLERAEGDLAAAIAELNRLFDEDVAAFRGKVAEAGITLLPEQEAITIGGD